MNGSETAGILSSVCKVPASYLAASDNQWVWRKSRASSFGDSKNHPGFNNEVNADTKPIPKTDEEIKANTLVDEAAMRVLSKKIVVLANGDDSDPTPTPGAVPATPL